MSLVMIDTSVWIQIFNKPNKIILNEKQLEQVAICPPILQDILQGIKDDLAHRQIKEALMSLPCFGSPINISTNLHASDLFRQGRKKGRTIRSSVDCLIAAIAIENNLPIWHQDRDFDQIGEYTNLQIVSGIETENT